MVHGLRAGGTASAVRDTSDQGSSRGISRLYGSYILANGDATTTQAQMVILAYRKRKQRFPL